jgi:23S rRNA (uracil1939-C5)-methyltransferase
LKRNDEIILVRAERPAYGGLSIARTDNGVLFIRGAIPGETVEARIDEQKKDYAFATAVKIIEPSADRTEPPCPVFGICGGCSLQYINYHRQVSIKAEVLLDSLRRAAKIDLPLAASLTDSNPWNYRQRGQFKISGNTIGFYREKSRDVVDITRCPLMLKEINELLNKTAGILKSEAALFGDVSELHITYGNGGIGLVKAKSRLPDAAGLSSALMSAGFKGICIESEHVKPLWFGENRTALELEGLKYAVSPQSFIQSHWPLNQKLVALMRNSLQPLKGKRVVDLYSGAGNFALPLALDAAEVVAIEDNATAIKDGKRNAVQNDIYNCRFLKGAVERAEIENFDVLLVDPPRLGLANSVVNRILALEAAHIVYVSCNPSTFARDLKKLLPKYDLDEIRLVDFFPQTYHIESLAFLILR